MLAAAVPSVWRMSAVHGLEYTNELVNVQEKSLLRNKIGQSVFDNPEIVHLFWGLAFSPWVEEKV
jgi:hypothetical protein